MYVMVSCYIGCVVLRRLPVRPRLGEEDVGARELEVLDRAVLFTHF